MEHVPTLDKVIIIGQQPDQGVKNCMVIGDLLGMVSNTKMS